MGIQGLLPFLKKSSRPIKLSEFKGKTAAVDVYGWLHKGAFACAEKLVRGESTNGYILYVMKQVNLLLSYNIKPILVFDGCHLPAKGVTEAKRRENRIKNRRKAKELLREGKTKEARECFQRCVDITSAMAHEVIKACRARNIDTIVAPYEADSQLAFLNLNGFADVVITEDSDLILFGCDKIIFKMDSNGGGILVEREKLHMSMNVPRDKFNFGKFRNMCILSGCDYLPSLHGIGLVKACKFFLVTSNPDVFTALCKLPFNLKMPHLEVTLEYRENFMKAINTLLHQLVFDPLSRTLIPLRPYPSGIGHDDMPYCGSFLGHEKAYQIALGNVDVQTGEIVDDFDPLNFKRPEIKSSSWNQKSGDLVSNHPSIWDNDYKVLIEDWRSGHKEKETSMKGKEYTVDISVLKRKRTVKEENDALSEDLLETLYSSKKKMKSETEIDDTEPVVEENGKNDSSDEMKKNQITEIITSTEEEITQNLEDTVTINNINKSSVDISSNEKECIDSCLTSQNVDTVAKDLPVLKSTPHRNPFAKKISSLPFNSENVDPLKPRNKVSVFQKLFTPAPHTIVRSRYFRTDDSLEEKYEESEEQKQFSPKSDNIENLPKESTRNYNTQEKEQVKSPLKTKNELILKVSPKTHHHKEILKVSPKTPHHKDIKSSFRWNNFSFVSKDRMTNSNKSSIEECGSKTSLNLPIVSNPLETPPSSQDDLDENYKFNNVCTSNLMDSRSSLDFLTPDKTEDVKWKVEGKETPKDTPNSKKNLSTPKCRISGLKKSPSLGKHRQLNLKDMFGFKKDMKKIASSPSSSKIL